MTMPTRPHVVVADPRPRARGVQRGQQLRGSLPGAFELYQRLFRTVGIGERDLREHALRIADAVVAWDHRYAEEIEGVAAGAGLDTWQLMALNGRTEILSQARSVQPECSTVAVAPRAGAPFGVQTWDWHSELDPFWHTQTVGGTRFGFVGLTEHGVLGKIGINSAGLGLFFNILGHRDDAPGGVPVHVLAAAVLGEAETVSEAVELLRSAPIRTSGAFTLLDTETAACAELSPVGVAVLRPADGYLPHTNHFLDPTNAQGEKPGLYEPDSQDRHALILSRLHDNPAPGRADDLLECLRSGPGQPRLCCAPAPDAVFGDRWATLATVLLEPAERTARVLAGSPLQAHDGHWVGLPADETVSEAARMTRADELVHYRGARIFTAGEPAWAESLIVRGERLHYVGDTATADAIAEGARTIDLRGAFVLPGFVDAHTHIVALGESLQQVDLFDAVDLADIQQRIGHAAAADPDAPRILGRSWLFGALDGRTPDRHMLDAAEPHRPVYLASNDLHSAWVNTAALRELGIDADTPDPIGGRIDRDPVTGEAAGMLYETAALALMRNFLDQTVTDAQRDAALAAAFDRYLADGVTGAVDMGLGEPELGALERALHRGGGTLPLRVAGHWLVERTASAQQNLAQVRVAADLQRRLDGPWLRVTGIKIMADGVIDSCTAAMKRPFADGSHPGPIWDFEALAPVVAAADDAGLQVAIHAIGDEASDIALAALEHAIAQNGPRDRRHRIEHLETVTEANVERLARLGVVASMQPVHADPAIQENWRAMLGDDRVERGYPWPEMTAAGAVLAFGTDAPTAPHPPLPNMYIATTRRSAVDPALAPNLPGYALPMARALGHATRDAAYSCRWEDLTGQLVAGKAADFVVLDEDPFTAGSDSLLRASVRMTVVGGAPVPSAV